MSDTPPHVKDQIRAADPRQSVFVTANAGSGKTSTLVNRVARLLLRVRLAATDSRSKTFTSPRSTARDRRQGTGNGCVP